MRIYRLIFINAFLCLAGSLGAEQLSGKVAVFIDKNNPITGILFPSIGLKGAPTPEADEVNQAILGEFQDPGLAIRTIEELKKKNGIKDGLVFAYFGHSTESNQKERPILLQMKCGISSVQSMDINKVEENQKVFGTRSNELGTWKNFKLATTSERVRAIAECLALMPGMPPLKTLRSKVPLKNLFIDKQSYEHGKVWMQAHSKVKASPEQLKRAFECMVSEAARNWPTVEGDSVIMRSVHHESEKYVLQSRGVMDTRHVLVKTVDDYTVFDVTREKIAKQIFSASTYDELSGLWGRSSMGLGSPSIIPSEEVIYGVPFSLELMKKLGYADTLDRFSNMFAKVMPSLPLCKIQAGIFEVIPPDFDKILQFQKVCPEIVDEAIERIIKTRYKR